MRIAAHNTSYGWKKRTGLLFISLLLCLHAELLWGATRIAWHADLSAASREARQDSKPILMKVSTSWCHYCVKMQQETFNDRAIVDRVESCFVPIAIDGDQQRELVQQLGIQSFPTTLIVSPDMQVLQKIVGFRSVQQLNDNLLQVCGPNPAASPAFVSSRGKMSVFGNLCPVTFSVDGRRFEGPPNISVGYEGYRLAFASNEHRAEFQRDPKRYWPVVDGVCVVSALDEQQVRFGSLEFATQYGGRHWLFASKQHLQQFLSAPQAYVRRLKALAKAKRNPAKQVAGAERAVSEQEMH